MKSAFAHEIADAKNTLRRMEIYSFHFLRSRKFHNPLGLFHIA